MKSESQEDIIIIDGKRCAVDKGNYHVVTEKSTGRQGIIVQTSRNSLSFRHTEGGDTLENRTEPEWIRIQFFYKKTGEFYGEPQWRRFAKFDITGNREIAMARELFRQGTVLKTSVNQIDKEKRAIWLVIWLIYMILFPMFLFGDISFWPILGFSLIVIISAILYARFVGSLE